MREAIENALRSNIATLLKATLFGFSVHLSHTAVHITISLSVHTTSEKLQKTVPKFSTVRPTATLILHENETFRDQS